MNRVRLAPAAIGILASPHAAVAFFATAAAGALLTAEGWAAATPAMLAPLLLLVSSLIAAILRKPRFRRDLPLLVFHLALIALVALFGIARLTYFDGATILSAGTTYTGDLVKNDRGPLHGDGPERLRFANEGFNEHFPERGRYHVTYNRVRWWTSDGASGVAEIGDDRPLILEGYRIYATTRRGFAPLFEWRPRDGTAEYGTVQLPDSGNEDIGPAVSWHLPGGPEAWVMLDARPPENGAPGSMRPGLGEHTLPHALVLRIGNDRHVLSPGDTLTLPAGDLRYLTLDSWMGYRIVYDRTEPWLIATVATGISALLWFYLRRLLRPIPLET